MTRKAHKQNFGTHPVPGQCLCLCVFLSLSKEPSENPSTKCVCCRTPWCAPYRALGQSPHILGGILLIKLHRKPGAKENSTGEKKKTNGKRRRAKGVRSFFCAFSGLFWSLFGHLFCWDPFDHSEGQFSLNAKKSEKKVSKFPGLLAPGGKKVRKEFKQGHFLTRFKLFSDFFAPLGLEAPGTHFETFFPDFFAFRLKCPSEWSKGSQGFWSKDMFNLRSFSLSYCQWKQVGTFCAYSSDLGG